MPPFTPTSRAVNIRSVQTAGSVQAQRACTSPTCLASGTGVGLSSIGQVFTSPPSCAPFAPLPLRSFIATTVALALRDLVHELRLFPQTGLPDSRERPS